MFLSGKVSLSSIPPSPEHFNEIFTASTFMNNIRSYNSMFSSTSMGAKVDHFVLDGVGPYLTPPK